MKAVASNRHRSDVSDAAATLSAARRSIGFTGRFR